MKDNYKISQTEIEEIINKSRREVNNLKHDYTIYNDWDKMMIESRIKVDKIFNENRGRR